MCWVLGAGRGARGAVRCSVAPASWPRRGVMPTSSWDSCRGKGTGPSGWWGCGEKPQTLRAPRGLLSWRELLLCVPPSFCDHSIWLRVQSRRLAEPGLESRGGSPSPLPGTRVPQSMNLQRSCAHHHAGAFRHHLVQDQQPVVLHAPVLPSDRQH